jgi:signal transduction protein with GAF and PtsI domain
VSAADERRARAYALIGGQPRTTDEPANVAELLRRVCGAAVLALPASGAGVSVMTGEGRLGFAAASDVSSEQLEDLQFTLGEGPCIDAYATRRPVLVPDLTDAVIRRWPMYVPAVHERGVRAVFAFPLQVGAGRLGVLDVFRDRSGQLTEEELAQALTFAEIAVMMVLDGQERAPSGGAPAGLDNAQGFLEISQAQGMIMVQLGVTITEALVRLRAYAYAEGRTVADVARDVVARRIQFDRTES